MKRTFAILLSLVVLLCSCSSASTSESTDKLKNGEPATPATADVGSWRSLGDEEDPTIWAFLAQNEELVSLLDGKHVFTGSCGNLLVMTNFLEEPEWLFDAIHALQEQAKEEQDEVRLLAINQAAARTDPYSYYAVFRIGRMDTSIISVVMESSSYTGASEVETKTAVKNFDMKKKRALWIWEILEDDGMDALQELVAQQLANAVNALYPNEAEHMVTLEYATVNNENWYFSSSGLVFFFEDSAGGSAVYVYQNEGETAYVESIPGSYQVEIPYEDLTGILLPEYFPDERTGEEGALEPREAGSQAETQIAVNLQAEDCENPWAVSFGSEHAVYDLRIYTGTTWVNEDTPIVGDMIYALNRLDEDAVFTVNSDLTGERVYLVCCTTAGGKRQVYTLDQYGIIQTALTGVE